MVAMAIVIIALFVILVTMACCKVASEADDEAEGFIMKPSVTPKPKAVTENPVREEVGRLEAHNGE